MTKVPEPDNVAAHFIKFTRPANDNGPVFLTHDSPEGGFALVYSIEFIV